MERIIAVIPQRPLMHFDIMVNGRFYCQISFKCLPGYKYKFEELRKKAIENRPSLKYKDFELIPTDNKI